VRAIFRILLVVLIGVGFTGQVAADQTDPRLDLLFKKLKSAEVFSIARTVEHEIWSIWLQRSGEPEVSDVMARGLRAMRESAFDDAVEEFGRVIELAPDFAEAWNKRATVYFLQGDYAASIADVRQTLLLEPRHFGALAGLGHINMALGRKADALAAYEAALEVHPYLSIRFQIEALREEVAGEKI